MAHVQAFNGRDGSELLLQSDAFAFDTLAVDEASSDPEGTVLVKDIRPDTGTTDTDASAFDALAVDQTSSSVEGWSDFFTLSVTSDPLYLI
jgi:hypothetical protein